MLMPVGRKGLFIGELAAPSGVSRKAVRLYESAGILEKPARTEAGYRVYGPDAVAVLAFVVRARRLGLTLAEIRDIVAIRRAGQVPCVHVRALLREKAADLEAVLAELRAVLGAWRSRRTRAGTVCPHIEERGGEPTWSSRRSRSARPAAPVRRSRSRGTRFGSARRTTSSS
jgi:DNA-binding transcriptional MerR regulator